MGEVSLLRDFEDSFTEEVTLGDEQKFLIREECSSQRAQHVDVDWRGGAQIACLFGTWCRCFFPVRPCPGHFSSDPFSLR